MEQKEKFTEGQVFEQARDLIENSLRINLSILEQRALMSIYVPFALMAYENKGSKSWDSIQPKIEASFRFLIDYFPISPRLAKFAVTVATPILAKSGRIRNEYNKFMQDYEEMHKP